MNIPCPNCRGAGTVALSAHLQQVLNTLRDRGASTPRQICTAIREATGESVTAQAMNNRLVVLESLELVERGARTGDGIPWRLAAAVWSNEPCDARR